MDSTGYCKALPGQRRATLIAILIIILTLKCEVELRVSFKNIKLPRFLNLDFIYSNHIKWVKCMGKRTSHYFIVLKYSSVAIHAVAAGGARKEV